MLLGQPILQLCCNGRLCFVIRHAGYVDAANQDAGSETLFGEEIRNAGEPAEKKKTPQSCR